MFLKTMSVYVHCSACEYIDKDGVEHTIYYDYKTKKYSEKNDAKADDEETSQDSTSSTSDKNTNASANDEADTDWEQFLKEYEKWADDYVAMVKNMKIIQQTQQYQLIIRK